MKRSRLNTATLVLALGALWSVYVAPDLATIVTQFPTVSGVCAASAGTVATGTTSRPADSSATPNSGPSSSAACSRPFALAGAPKLPSSRATWIWWQVAISVLMIAVAARLRIRETSPWTVRAMVALVVAQVIEFVVIFDIAAAQAGSSTMLTLPLAKASFGVLLPLWCLGVFREAERIRTLPVRRFEGPHLVEQVEAEAINKALLDGGAASPAAMPWFMRPAEPATASAVEAASTSDEELAAASAAAQSAAGDPLLEVSGALGVELLGGWIDCAATTEVHCAIGVEPDSGIELLLADESGTWRTVPQFPPVVGGVAIALPAGRWYVAVRDNAGRGRTVAFTVTRGRTQAA